ncbi:membrane-associated protein, putative, partial [Bodo saltans]
LPRYSRWVWVVGPLVSMAVIILNTIEPWSDRNGSIDAACNGLQGAAIGTMSLTAMLYAILRPHRAILASSVVAFGHGHSALVSLLGLLSRHEVVSHTSMVTVAVVGAYISMIGKVTVFVVAMWEAKFLAKHQRRGVLVSQVKVVATNSGRFEKDELLFRGRDRRFKTGAALRRLITLACLSKSSGDDASPDFIWW